MKYRIYPPIGFARVGNSSEFFIASESLGSPGLELKTDGTESPVTEYKDSSKNTKRQAARFRIFAFDDDGSPGTPFALPSSARIEWTVHMVNKKDAVVRTGTPPAPPAPGVRFRPTTESGMDNRIIDSGARTITGLGAAPVPLVGNYRGTEVTLGELRTDSAGRLIVLGGSGVSRLLPGAPPSSGNFFTNRGWFDDVGDGSVTAKIVFADGTEAVPEPGWIVSGPPDFAPAVRGVVTLFDLMRDVAYTSGWMQLPAKPSFEADIKPILERANALQWVNDLADWPAVPTKGDALEKPFVDAASVAARTAAERAILDIESKADGSTGLLSHTDTPYTKFVITEWQKKCLAKWVAGEFLPGTPAAAAASDELTRAALEATVGQTLFPGIEVGVIARDASIYSTPFDFRLSHAQIQPGDMTALMALPWQADFWACDSNWWPSQRPNDVNLADGERDSWMRADPTDLEDFVQKVMKLGVVQEAVDATGERTMREAGSAF